MTRKIKTDCTPRYEILLDIDPNPNGLPILWMSFNSDNNKRLLNIPLGKEATEKLTRELQKHLAIL